MTLDRLWAEYDSRRWRFDNRRGKPELLLAARQAIEAAIRKDERERASDLALDTLLDIVDRAAHGEATIGREALRVYVVEVRRRVSLSTTTEEP